MATEDTSLATEAMGEESTASETSESTEEQSQEQPSFLSPDKASLPQAAKFKSADALFDSYVELEKKIGAVEAEKPPEKPDDYDFPTSLLPDGLQYDKATLNEFKEQVHQLGLSQKKASQLLGWYLQRTAGNVKRANEAAVASIEEGRQRLQAEWGDQTEANLTVTGRAMRQFATDGFKQLMDQTGLGNHPEAIKTFHAIGKAMGEDQFVNGSVQREREPIRTFGYDKMESQFAEREGGR